MPLHYRRTTLIPTTRVDKRGKKWNNSRLCRLPSPNVVDLWRDVARTYLLGPDFIFISHRLTKSRPKSFEDITYRSIRCLIWVETWTCTPFVIDNGDDRWWFRRFGSNRILISHDIFVPVSLKVSLKPDRQMNYEKRPCLPVPWPYRVENNNSQRITQSLTKGQQMVKLKRKLISVSLKEH